jgi:hypothetical protein
MSRRPLAIGRSASSRARLNLRAGCWQAGVRRYEPRAWSRHPVGHPVQRRPLSVCHGRQPWRRELHTTASRPARRTPSGRRRYDRTSRKRSTSRRAGLPRCKPRRRRCRCRPLDDVGGETCTGIAVSADFLSLRCFSAAFLPNPDAPTTSDSLADHSRIGLFRRRGVRRHVVSRHQGWPHSALGARALLRRSPG